MDFSIVLKQTQLSEALPPFMQEPIMQYLTGEAAKPVPSYFFNKRVYQIHLVIYYDILPIS
jgi:hypothetical protein